MTAPPLRRGNQETLRGKLENPRQHQKTDVCSTVWLRSVLRRWPTLVCDLEVKKQYLALCQGHFPKAKVKLVGRGPVKMTGGEGDL